MRTFCAIPVGPGEHQIEVRYRPGPIKPILLNSRIYPGRLNSTKDARPGYAGRENKLAARLSELATPSTLHGHEPPWRLRSLYCCSRAHCSPEICSTAMIGSAYPPVTAKVLSDHRPPYGRRISAMGMDSRCSNCAPPLIYAVALPFFEMGMSLADSLQFGWRCCSLLARSPFPHRAKAIFLSCRFNRRGGRMAFRALSSNGYLRVRAICRVSRDSGGSVALLGLIAVLQIQSALDLGLALAVAMLPLAHNAVPPLLCSRAVFVAVRSIISDRRLKPLWPAWPVGWDFEFCLLLAPGDA